MTPRVVPDPPPPPGPPMPLRRALAWMSYLILWLAWLTMISVGVIASFTNLGTLSYRGAVILWFTFFVVVLVLNAARNASRR